MEQWQCQHIRSNITALIQLTNCNTILIAKLSESKLLSSNDVDCLKRVRSTEGQIREVFELYELLQSRKNAYEKLISALEFTNQSGAVEILQKGFSQHNILQKTSKSAELFNAVSDQDEEPLPSTTNILELNSMEQNAPILSPDTNMDFNTLVRTGNGEILGKLQLKVRDFYNLPLGWRLTYKNKSLHGVLNFDWILCNDKFPISVYISQDMKFPGYMNYESYRHAIYLKRFQVFVKLFNGKTKTFNVGLNTRVIELKRSLNKTEGIAVEEMRLLLAGTQLENDRYLSDYLITQEATLQLVSKLRGGGDLQSVNLNERPVKRHGVAGKYRWRRFSAGLNVCGVCPNQSCKSKQSTNPVTVCQVGYGDICLNRKQNKFECPVCESYFTPNNFLVSSARAIFRFRKKDCLENQQILLKSSGGLNSYTELYSNGKKIKYDAIEIRTVKKTESVYTCVRCDKMIEKKKQLFIYDCSHAVHLKCKYRKGCYVCRAKFITEQDFRSFISNYLDEMLHKSTLVRLEQSVSVGGSSKRSGYEIASNSTESLTPSLSNESYWKFLSQCCNRKSKHREE